MEPIRVLQLIDGLNVGGAEVLLRDLTRGLLDDGRFQVSIGYSSPGPLLDQIVALGVPVTRLPRLARVDPLLLLNTWRLIRRTRPHVVHSHLFKSDFHGRPAARMAGVPVVVSTLHNNSAWARRPLLGPIYGANARLADRLIAVSEEVRDFSLEAMRLSPAQVVAIRNGVPIERFVGNEAAGRALRAELGIAADAPLCGVVARLSPQKDHRNFLRAAAQVHAALPNARFLIVGDGELRAELEALARELGLGAAVIFAGIRSDVPAVLAALDLLVFSSAWEGLPVALLEAMASSRAVVSTAVGGVPGVLVDGSTGLLAPPGEPAALAAAMAALLGDAERRAAMGRAGHARVVANYSIQAMVKATIDLYLSLLAGRGVAAASTRQQEERA
jgi:glycosyltransferase involved in cell wall biosynthesis